MEVHRHDFVVKLLCGSLRVKPSRKVTCMNTVETIMKGHLHEHDRLCASVPLVMFVEGGVVVWCGVVVSSRGQCDGVRVVVSCDHESGLCVCLYMCFFDVFSFLLGRSS